MYISALINSELEWTLFHVFNCLLYLHQKHNCHQTHEKIIALPRSFGRTKFPVFWLGIKPLGPKTLANGFNSGITSFTATHFSNLITPFLIYALAVRVICVRFIIGYLFEESVITNHISSCSKCSFSKIWWDPSTYDDALSQSMRHKAGSSDNLVSVLRINI